MASPVESGTSQSKQRLADTAPLGRCLLNVRPLLHRRACSRSSLSPEASGRSAAWPLLLVVTALSRSAAQRKQATRTRKLHTRKVSPRPHIHKLNARLA
eukprot:4274051-Pleurochrysis_carterae.AAC.1